MNSAQKARFIYDVFLNQLKLKYKIKFKFVSSSAWKTRYIHKFVVTFIVFIYKLVRARQWLKSIIYKLEFGSINISSSLSGLELWDSIKFSSNTLELLDKSSTRLHPKFKYLVFKFPIYFTTYLFVLFKRNFSNIQKWKCELFED